MTEPRAAAPGGHVPPDGDDSATPSSPHSEEKDWESTDDEGDDTFPTYPMHANGKGQQPGGAGGRQVQIVDMRKDSLDSRSSRFKEGTKSFRENREKGYRSEGGTQVFENPTVRLAVAMEMSSALPTTLGTSKKQGPCSKLCSGRHADALPATFGHCCFIAVLVSYMMVIIMQLMFLAHSPVPFGYMDSFEDFAEWPLLPKFFLKKHVNGYTPKPGQLRMSPIPIMTQYCNFIKSKADPSPDIMNFNVHLWLDDPKISMPKFRGGYQAGTVYPVIMASTDWDTWWIVADRNQTFPTPYFRSHVAVQEFRFIAPECTRQPAVESGGKDLALDVERFTTHGTYLVACVVWDRNKMIWHRNNTNMTKEDVAKYCDAFGGLGGLPCHYGRAQDDVQLVGKGEHVFVTPTDKIAQAVRFKGANFSGSITLSEAGCWPGWDLALHGHDSCVGGAARFSEWTCHTCMDDQLGFYGPWPNKRPWIKPNGTETTTQPPSSLYVYKSFPRFDVTLRGALNVTRKPHVYMVTSPFPQGDPNGLHHNLEGVWTKLYDEQKVVRPGWPQVDVNPREDFTLMKNAWKTPTSYAVGVLDEQDNSMVLHELNKVTIKPDSPFGPRGKLYIAACIVNRTTYDSKFNFTLGQNVRPPPFNDRCIAVVGRCALACSGVADYSEIQNCDDQGNIVGLTDRIEPPFNDSMMVKLLMLTMAVGFGVKLITYIPGLFTPYPHCAKYNHVMTQMLGYIAVGVPTNGESKAVVIRNLVGAVSCLPKHCSCRFHVILVDEGHRKCLQETWRKFCRVLELLLLFGVNEEDDGNHVYISGAEDMLLDSTQRARSTVILKMFLKFWSEDSRKTTLRQLEKKPYPDEPILNRMCGLNALERTKDETGMEEAETKKMRKLCEALMNDMKDQKKIVTCLHLDVREDWPLGEINVVEDDDDRPSEIFFHGIGVDVGWRSADSTPILLQLPLRLHYLARSRPPEDERTIKVQEVAPGTWSYVLPEDSEWQDWLELRKNAAPYESGLETALMPDENFVPVWTSRGKAGGLNFALNYMHWYAGMLDESLREDRKDLRMGRKSSHSIVSEWDQMDSEFALSSGLESHAVPSCHQHVLFSICDARHQYQPDFMHRVVPYFFKPGKRMFELDTSVSFCQTPQYFPEISEGLDFLDNNNALFFRLNCMLRNSCGGVSSCGTNGTWLVPPRETGEIWAKPSRVIGSVAARQMHEFTFFHECCKIEDTASSLEQVLKGKRSQYCNYRLSYGCAKQPTDYLAAVQRWAEGGVVLSLQTFTCHLEQNNRFVFMFAAVYAFFMSVLIRGLAIDSSKYTNEFLFKHIFPDWDSLWKDNFRHFLKYVSDDGYTDVELDIHIRNFTNSTVVIVALALQFVFIWFLTEISATLKRCCGIRFFPTGGRWWARLMICFDNLTYFLWFWTALYWIAFNFSSVVVKKGHFYDPTLMTIFAFAAQTLGWGLILSATARNSKHEMLEANEVASIGITTIWRGTQLFYMTVPLTIYAILMGIGDFLKWKHFNQDISFWTGGDRGQATKNMVKWWCLFLMSGAVFAWIWFFAGNSPSGKNDGAAAAVIVVTFISLDVLHPCAYLWLGDPQFAPEAETKRLKGYTKCIQKVRDLAWWRRRLFYAICAGWVVSLVKWLGPMNQVFMPFALIFLPSLGLNQAFTSLISAPRA